MSSPSLTKSNSLSGQPLPTYIPPNMVYKSPSEILLPPGRYFKAGYRSRVYPGLTKSVEYWDISSPLTVNISGTYSLGVNPGFVGGKVANSWNSVFLMGNSASDVLLLPFIKVLACRYDEVTDKTLVSVDDHEAAGSYVDLTYPSMTSNSAPSPFVTSASSVYSTSYDAWMAFDGSTGAQGWHSGGGVPQWIKFDFGTPTLVDTYRLCSRYDGSQWATAWRFEGSNDNTNWDTLDSRSGVSVPGSGAWTGYYSTSNTAEYRYYRIYCTTASSYCAYGEIEFYKTTGNSYFITSDDQFNNYRAVKIAFDGSDGVLTEVVDTSDSNNTLSLPGSQVAPEDRHASAFCQDFSNDIMYLFSGIVFTQTPSYTLPASGTTGDSVFYLSDTWQYELKQKRWTKLITSGGLPFPRSYASLVHDSTNNTLLLFGGANSSGTLLNDLWKLDLSTKVWSQLSPTGGPPAIRRGHAACYDAVTQSMYIVTGAGLSYLNDVWMYSVPNNTWTQMSPTGSSPSIRGFVGFCYTPSRSLYLFGGYDGTNHYNTIYKYEVDGNNWSLLSPASSPSARRHSLIVYNQSNNSIYLHGGFYNTPPSLDDFWVYSVTGNTWTQILDTPGANCAQVGACYDNKVVSSTGYIAAYRKYRSDTWEFDVESSQCTRINCGMELRRGDMFQLVPPEDTPCLYVGTIRLDSSGNIKQFIKNGWVYRWFAAVNISGYMATGGSPPDPTGTYSGNTYVGTAVPPQAISAYLGAQCGDSGARSISGVMVILYSDDGTVQIYNEYNWETTNTYKLFESPINWTFFSIQSIRNQFLTHVYGTQYTPQVAYFRFAGFEE